MLTTKAKKIFTQSYLTVLRRRRENMGINREAYAHVLGKQNTKIARKPKNNNLEYQLQQWLVNWLASQNILYCANAGAGVKLTIGQAVKVKRSGYRAGYPDINIDMARGVYHGMKIEVKVGRNSYPSEMQKAWQDCLNMQGYYSVIMPPLEYHQAVEWIRERVTWYMNLKEGESL